MTTIPVMLLICCLILIPTSQPVSASRQTPSGIGNSFHQQYSPVVEDLGLTVAKQHLINDGSNDPSAMPDASTTRSLLRGASSKFVTQKHPKGSVPPAGPSCENGQCNHHA
ncbi:hypothetical protein O6H91_08G063200 [Diphasiastrum complanatum]|uniref:Uncharacterized protein n=1 Tax=Diphasiastrum complanatum TaxID=34168 RepID=A0ACC2CY65_DIPCM|nr:hypothetical protein O6H91_08G063200 [Diphasiastrum complanatum]